MLLMRLYALYQRSNKILAFLVTFFLAEFAAMLYIYVNFSSTAKVINQPLPGAYLCGSSSYGWIDYIMYPPLLFELTLVGLCLWAGYQHSKEHFSAPRLRWSRAHLIDILIRGNINIFYFFSFLVVWVIAIVALFVFGVQWSPSIFIFALVTCIIGGCRLVLHLREGASSVLHSARQLIGGSIFVVATVSDA